MTHPLTAEIRMSRAALADRLGIDAAFIDRLVERFYASVRIDPMLAPIFAERVDDWAPHLERMKQFWAAILRADGSFHGNPMLKHITIPGIDVAQFERWLDLFDGAVLAEAPTTEAVALVNERARSIAASLLAGVRRHRADPTHPLAEKGKAHA